MLDKNKEVEKLKTSSGRSVIMHLTMWLKNGLFFCFISLCIFFSSLNKVSADEIDWTEVANTTNGIQFIDTKSIKYTNKGILSVLTKFYEINPDDQAITNTKLYLMAIDCDNRLFSNLPVNGDPKQVKNWDKPVDDKLIKKTIFNSCSY